jgi:hypothetical protein
MHKLPLALKRILKDFNPAGLKSFKILFNARGRIFSRSGLWNAGFLPTESFKIPMGWFLA